MSRHPGGCPDIRTDVRALARHIEATSEGRHARHAGTSGGFHGGIRNGKRGDILARGMSWDIGERARGLDWRTGRELYGNGAAIWRKRNTTWYLSPSGCNALPRVFVLAIEGCALPPMPSPSQFGGIGFGAINIPEKHVSTAPADAHRPQSPSKNSRKIRNVPDGKSPDQGDVILRMSSGTLPVFRQHPTDVVASERMSPGTWNALDDVCRMFRENR